MSYLHPAFDWREVARLALASRLLDELEEKELTPSGLVISSFRRAGMTWANSRNSANC
ncbi:MAG: hypothetical protein IPM76_18500 [Chloroflexi bacterium]|nr:hypothetical protein [Chloroflexota bacterium]